MENRKDESHKPVTVAWTGASGLAYGVRLADVLLRAGRDVLLLLSEAVEQTAPVEMGRTAEELVAGLRDVAAARGVVLHTFGRRDFSAPAASGSAPSAGMVVCPCTMGTLARIAVGSGDDLLHRAADVCLKEGRRLILVPRETPLATHHLRNMAQLSADGAVILPAMPGFYNRPRRIEDLIDFVVQRICDRLDIDVRLTARWGDRGGEDEG